MERSQSCSSFDVSHNNNNNNNSSNNNSNTYSKHTLNNNNNNIKNITKSLQMLQGLTTHQIHNELLHEQQQQQQQFQHSGHSGSTESLNIMATTTISATSASITLSRYSSRRKNKLQRQASTRNNDSDEFHNETSFPAGLEDHERVADVANHDAVSMQLYQKHRQFAQHKPQSEPSMIITTTKPSERHLQHEDSFDSTATVDQSPASQRRQRFAFWARDNSVHSDSSCYSSVDSLLEARKPDPEAILINLGFGPVGSEDILSRIPKRFLKPSQVRGIDTGAFVKRLQLASNLADHSVLGYRGLTGNPDVPPSSIVAKIMQRFEVNQRKKSMGGIE